MTEFERHKIGVIEVASGSDMELEVRAKVMTRGGARFLLTLPGEENDIIIAHPRPFSNGGIIRHIGPGGQVVHYKFKSSSKE